MPTDWGATRPQIVRTAKHQTHGGGLPEPSFAGKTPLNYPELSESDVPAARRASRW